MLFRWWCWLFHRSHYRKDRRGSPIKGKSIVVHRCGVCGRVWFSVGVVALVLLLQGLAWSQAESVVGKAIIGGPVSPDGKAFVTCDLPVELRTKNVGGRDGAGLCVFSSVGHAARYQNERRLWDFQRDMRQEPGGGYPEKLERMIEKYGHGTPYIQYVGRDAAFLEMVLRTGRMVSVTYTRVHMVNLIYLDDQWAAVLDNNFVGEREIRWHKRAEFLSMWTDGGQGWAVALLAPRPPAPPFN